MTSYKDLPAKVISEIREEVAREIRERHTKELEVIYQDAMECREESEMRLNKYRKLSNQLRSLKEQKKRRDAAYRRDVDAVIEKMLDLESEINFDKKSMIVGVLNKNSADGYSNKHNANYPNNANYPYDADCGAEADAPNDFPATNSSYLGMSTRPISTKSPYPIKNSLVSAPFEEDGEDSDASDVEMFLATDS